MKCVACVLLVFLCGCEVFRSGEPDGGGGGDGATGGNSGGGGGGEGTGGGGGVAALPLARAVQVRTATNFACARTDTRKLRCWGLSDSDGPIFGQPVDRTRVFSPVETLSDVEDFSIYSRHACAVFTGGSVKCWGSGWMGKLGNGNDLDSEVPVEVVGISTAIQVGVGADFSCALLAEGTIKCWGADFNGELLGQHQPGLNASFTPVDLPGIGADFVQLRVTALGVCGLKANHTAVCWGNTWAPEPATADPTSGAAPFTASMPGVEDLVVYSSGGYAIVNGALKSWGSARAGSLGNGTDSSFIEELEPIDVPGLSTGVTALSDAAAVKDGEVWVWGIRSDLGAETIDPRGSTTPVKVNGLHDVVAVSVAWNDLTCALTAAGSVYCWGRHYFGQVGNGSDPEGEDVHYVTPQKVASFY